jgi:hypothetical protein
MNTCYVSHQIDNYLHDIDVCDAFNEKVNARISKLLDKEYNPKTHEHIMETLGQLNSDQEAILVAMVNHSACTLSVMIKSWVSGYWETLAEKQAIKELSE